MTTETVVDKYTVLYYIILYDIIFYYAIVYLEKRDGLSRRLPDVYDPVAQTGRWRYEAKLGHRQTRSSSQFSNSDNDNDNSNSNKLIGNHNSDT